MIRRTKINYLGSRINKDISINPGYFAQNGTGDSNAENEEREKRDMCLMSLYFRLEREQRKGIDFLFYKNMILGFKKLSDFLNT